MNCLRTCLSLSFDKESSGEVFGRLSGIMNERSKESGESEGEDGKKEEVKQKQIVCIVFYDYDIKETAFFKIFAGSSKRGRRVC